MPQTQEQQLTQSKVITLPSSELTIEKCLTGVQLSAQVRAHGYLVHQQLVDEVNKCAIGLGVTLTAEQLQLFVSDLVEVCKFDSMEDIMIVLKQGRQGAYGTTYNKFTMIIFRECFNYLYQFIFHRIVFQLSL